MIKAVIFDLDGTLVDTPHAIVETFTATFADLGVSARSPTAIRATIGLPLSQAFGKLLGLAVDDARTALAVDRYLHFFQELVLPVARRLVFPGVVEGLTALTDCGLPLAVATSKLSRSAEALLVATGLREWFTVVVGADQVTRPKPDPESARLVTERMGIRTADAVMVGDTTHDLLMATAAGMPSIAVTYGIHTPTELASARPTWIADSFDDVLAHLQRVVAEPLSHHGR